MSACVAHPSLARRAEPSRLGGVGEQVLDRCPQRPRRRRPARICPVSPSTIVSVWPVVRVQTIARPIDMASRIVVMPAWKSVSCSGHDDEGGVGVELAEIELVAALER